jgi:integrase
VAKFSRYFGRSPDRLGLEDVRAFSGPSGVDRHLVGSPQPDGLCAPFLLRRYAGHGEIPERIPYACTPRKLPTVLSGDEVVRFLEAVAGFKMRAALVTAYAAGLRASEVVRLKVSDVDSRRGWNGYVIHTSIEELAGSLSLFRAAPG